MIKKGDSKRSSQIIRNFEELKQQVQINNQLRQERQSQLGGTKTGIAPTTQPVKDAVAGNRAPLNNYEIELLQQTKVSQAHIKSTDELKTHPKPSEKLDKQKDQLKKEAANSISEFDDHRITLEELKQRYSTDYEKGLTHAHALEMNRIHGDNKLTDKKRKSLILLFLKEITHGFALLLWFGAALCFIAYGLDPQDVSNLYLGVIICFVNLLTGIITFQQNMASEALMESFKNFLPQNCKVLRDGRQEEISALKLVQGDIVFVKSGDKIPADIRILQSSEMKVDNSALTGESEPLLRTVDCSHPDNPMETSNLAFFGTLCKEGNGKGIVVRIGDATTLGQIANLSSAEKEVKSPLKQEIDRFVLIIFFIAVGLGVLFFLLGYLVVEYEILPCVLFGIGILVSNVPEGLLGCVTVSLAITAKTLSQKNVLVKNLEGVETLGSTSCICSDKTGTLTQNVMTVEHLWYNNKILKAVNKSIIQPNQTLEYDEKDADFIELHRAAILSSDAKFKLNQAHQGDNQNDNHNEKQKEEFIDPSKPIDYKKCPAMGDATETGLIRFFQYIEDVEITRHKFKMAQSPDGEARLMFNSTNKFALTVIEYDAPNSDYCIYIKGAPEKIWTFCSQIQQHGVVKNIDDQQNTIFQKVNLDFGKRGERVLGFAKLHLPRSQYPKPQTLFTVSHVDKFNFKMQNFTFVGLVSLIDPPKTRVPGAILECRAAGIKVIMVTGDQPPTAAAIARQVNIIPKKVKTNDELIEEEGISWDEAAEKCNAIVVHGEKITRSLDKEIQEGLPPFTYLRRWVTKPYCVFARTTPAQKLQIVQACQAEGYICAVTGDGVNDSPAIKQGDIGVSMNISGSDVTKDAADMILLDDDFASIVQGVEEGRKVFDNLKKSIIYVLTSNIPEILPFIAFIIFQIPLPITNIYMIVIDIGTDILPSISLGYEIAEIDVMTRKPRKRDDHLLTWRALTHSYLLMGPISLGGGFIGYYTTFNQLGFPIQSLFGMATFTGIHKPPIGDFSEGIGCKNTYNNDCAYFNSNFMNNNANSCIEDEENAIVQEWKFNWLTNPDGEFDLRKTLIYCNRLTGKWTPQIPWSHCDQENYISPITNVTACYSVEALKYAQTAWLLAVVWFQWSNVICLKGRQTSYSVSCVNKVMFFGMGLEIVVLVFLCYTPGVQWFVADGVFNAELHCFFSKSLQDAGYAGIEVRRTPMKIEIRIKATKPQHVVGVQGKKLNELTYFLQKRFGYADDQLQILAENVKNKGLCASAQVEALAYKLLKDVPVRLAANYIIRQVISDGAKGCEVIISGKLQQQRAKTMKFKQGYMICTGQPKKDYVDVAVRHVFFKQGIMGVKVKIMLPYDPSGKHGVRIPIPDNVIIAEPKRDDHDKEIRTAQEQAPQQQEQQQQAQQQQPQQVQQ